MINTSLEVFNKSFRFSIAPMVDYTDKHFRVLIRQITKKSYLYTEMVVAQALFHTSNKNKFLNFSKIEHPISLQLGGNNPEELAYSASLAEEWGYDEVNFNLGCPSSKVKSGNFGACLMNQTAKVARCIEAMANSTKLPITVKHRIGVDNFENNSFLLNFLDNASNAGAKRFSIHARKALLNGLSPKENREIPPLNYEKVFELKKLRPNLIIELNGGINSPKKCNEFRKNVDGIMVGRSIYKNPMLWKDIDQLLFNIPTKKILPSEIIENLIPYIEEHLKSGGKTWDIAKHFLNLVQNVSGAKKWRENIRKNALSRKTDISFLEKAVNELKETGL